MLTLTDISHGYGFPTTLLVVRDGFSKILDSNSSIAMELFEHLILILGCFQATYAVTDIKVGLLFSDLGWPLHYRHFKPACDIAIATVNDLAAKGVYLNLTIDYEWSATDNFCGNPFMRAPGIASEIYNQNNIKAFFGPPCSQETFGVADLSAFWNIPILSGASTSAALDQKDRYRTFTRTSYKLSTLVSFLLRLFDEFGWNATGVLWDAVTYWPLVAMAVRDLFKNNNVAVNYVSIMDYPDEASALVETIKRGRSE